MCCSECWVGSWEVGEVGGLKKVTLQLLKNTRENEPTV